jgi:putative membrane protein
MTIARRHSTIVPGLRSLSLTLVACMAMAVGAAPQSSGLTSGERDSLEKISHANQASIEFAQLAERNGSSDEVRRYARSALAAHRSMEHALEQLAKAKGVALPTEPDLPQRARRRQIAGLKGARFDKVYLQDHGIDAHETVIVHLQNLVADAKDPDVKAYATQTIPEEEKLLKAARALDPVLTR